MTIKDVTQFLEQKFPLYLQEDFDNCGVQCGDVQQEITGAMVCFEMSEQVIDEAIAEGCNLVISHHPLILKRGITKIVPTDRVGAMICKAPTSTAERAAATMSSQRNWNCKTSKCWNRIRDSTANWWSSCQKKMQRH